MSKVASYVVSGFVMLGYVLPAQAGIFKRSEKWLKTQRCELMLSPQVQELQVEHNYLNAIRAAGAKLENSLKGEHAPVYFGDFAIQGSISQLGPKQKSRAIARLNGIERSLIGGHPDTQIAAIELRGAQITKALDTISQLEVSLAKDYADLSAKLDGGVGYKITGSVIKIVLRAAGVLSFMAFAEEITHIPYHPVTALGYMALYSLLPLLNGLELLHEWYRFDSQSAKLRDFLVRLQSSENKDLYYHYADALLVPAEFNRSVFNCHDPEIVQEGREQVHGIMGRAFFPTMFGVYPGQSCDELDQELQREVSNAGNTDRYVYLDHVAYYDNATREPVWLFVYRSFTSRQHGNKPRREQEKASAASDWGPGLKPVGF